MKNWGLHIWTALALINASVAFWFIGPTDAATIGAVIVLGVCVIVSVGVTLHERAMNRSRER